MMQCIQATAVRVSFEHREIDDPQRPPVAFEQVEIMTEFIAQGAERIVDDICLVSAEEDQVARLRARALEDALNGIVRQELQDRRLQPVAARGALGDLDVGQPLGAVDGG